MRAKQHISELRNDISPPRHVGLDLLGSAALTLALIPTFLGLDMKVEMAVPLALLTGIISHHVLQLILNPGNHDLFSPTTLAAAYFATYFALRCFYLANVPFFSRLGRNPYDDYLPDALWCACIGYSAFLAGMGFEIWSKSIVCWRARFQDWPRSVPTVRILFLMFIGILSLLYLFKIGMTVGNYGNLEFQRHPPPGMIVLSENLIDLTWVALCVFVVTGSKKVRGGAWPLIALSVAALGAKLAISGGKVALIQPLLQAGLVFHYGKRRFRVWELLAYGLPVLILSFGVVNFYRFVVVGHLGSPKSLSDVVSRISATSDLLKAKYDTAAQASPFQQMVSRDGGVDSLALIMKYTPHPFPYAYGLHWLEIPLTFVPRWIWPGKPVNMPSAEFETTYMGEPSTYNGFSSMQMISDLYRNFYYPGAIVGMFGFGVTLRLFYKFCSPSRVNVIGLYLYAALFPEIVHSFEADLGYGVINISRTAALALATALFLGVTYHHQHTLKAHSQIARAEWRSPTSKATMLTSHNS